MYAVIETGGKQYRVKEGDIFFVEKLPGEKKSQVIFDQILLIGQEDSEAQIGAPVLSDARVACEVIEQFRSKKILVYKFKRRKKFRRRQGHRQNYTRLRVVEIAPNGKLTGKSSAPVSFENEAVAG